MQTISIAERFNASMQQIKQRVEEGKHIEPATTAFSTAKVAVNNSDILPFGKFKGQAISSLNDDQYLKWLAIGGPVGPKGDKTNFLKPDSPFIEQAKTRLVQLGKSI
jgi:uncharacterized protein (DUF3820 family)